MRKVLMIVMAAIMVACQTNTEKSQYGDNPYKKYTEGLPFEMPEVKAPVFPDRTVTLSDYEAVGDGQQLCTDAFAKAIDFNGDKTDSAADYIALKAKIAGK